MQMILFLLTKNYKNGKFLSKTWIVTLGAHSQVFYNIFY